MKSILKALKSNRTNTWLALAALAVAVEVVVALRMGTGNTKRCGSEAAREVSERQETVRVSPPKSVVMRQPRRMDRRRKIDSGNTNAVAAHMPDGSREFMQEGLGGVPEEDAARLASEKNQVMDALLNQPQIPADYADVMICLYRDKTRDVVTRDFAVQHIGHCALALNRRGLYDPDSAEARGIRAALFDAAAETDTIVAAAAFRALADMAEFDVRLDVRRLDSLLVSCISDAGGDLAARSMAVQLCGERRVASSRPALEAILADPSSPEILRRSARRSSERINGKEIAQ